MGSGGTAAAQFPIRFTDIIFAEVLDPNGQNPKTRRADYVKLPYKNPPGRHPKTGLTKEAAVLCTGRRRNVGQYPRPQTDPQIPCGQRVAVFANWPCRENGHGA